MKFRLKKKLLILLSPLLCFVLLCSAFPVHATETETLEKKTAELKIQLEGINQELTDLGNQIADTEEEIADANEEMLRIQDSLAISQENTDRQYESMKSRIKYMYENGNSYLLELLFSAENMTDFLNKADFVQSISEYDRDKLESLQAMADGISQQESDLKEKQDSLAKLQSQLVSQKEELTVKAAETNTNLEDFNVRLAAARAEELKKAEGAAKVAEANSGQTPSNGTPPESGTGNTNNSGSNSPTGNGGYNYPTSGGALTPEKGVVYFNGHRETYYSQRVLPGGGLNIPGRHVAPDGTIRDADGYICVASSDLPWGTIVETSLGTGKVYDCGCASGTIDIYTDW